MNPVEAFAKEVSQNIEGLGQDKHLKEVSVQWNRAVASHKYGYNFTWLGRPIIQIPQDIYAMQEIIWRVQPDLIIETGIAHGGSLILSASILELNSVCGGNPDSMVLGIDIDIRAHNLKAIKEHPLSKRISMIEGSSISNETIEKVKSIAKGKERILLVLDSNHTHEHVLAELEAYAPLVSVGSYCVVFDTMIEDLPEFSGDRPWGKGNNPKTAVFKYLESHPEFENDTTMENKLVLSCAPNGYLKRIR